MILTVKLKWSNHPKVKTTSKTPLQEKFAPTPCHIPNLECTPIHAHDKDDVMTLLASNYPSLLPEVRERTFEAICDRRNFMLQGYKFQYTSQESESEGLAYLSFSYSTEVGGLCVHVELLANNEDTLVSFAPLFFEWLHASYPKARRFSFHLDLDYTEAEDDYGQFGYSATDDLTMVRDVTLP